MSSEGKHSRDLIPRRWTKCPPKSYELLINKFLIFKTPLSDRYNDQVKDDIFQVKLVFQSMKNQRLKLGLWIDLTNTRRYYDETEVEMHGCQYLKLPCEGVRDAPTPTQASAFIDHCEKFICQHPNEIIGVHCTHGFNRSGFLVSSFLVENLGWAVGAAIAEFARIRPPGIYKEEYIKELFRRYDEIEVAPKAPPLPDWCFEEDVHVEEYHDSFPNDSELELPKGKRRRIEKPGFMKGIYGVEMVSSPLLEEIQKTVKEMCGSTLSNFPGCQPVSLSVANIELLSKKPYRVSWKADGVRYMLYIKGRNEVYCIDRNNSVFHVKNLTFPFKKDLRVHITKTLLDGEMVIDKVDGMNKPRYLVYDAIEMMGYKIRERNFFPERYMAIQKEITEPRDRAIMKGLISKSEEPFSIRAKEFWDIKDTKKLLTENFQKSLCHEPDGLIFQPSEDEYVPGRCNQVLKWKPPSLNTVDFRLKIVTASGEGILKKKIGELYVDNKSRFGVLRSIKNVKHLDSKIIECKFENGEWVFLRERTDKTVPNSFETAESVFWTIKNPVTDAYLLRYIDVNRYIK